MLKSEELHDAYRTLRGGSMGRDWEETGGRRVGMGIVEREKEGGRRRERWDDCTYFGGCVQSTGHISQVSVVVHDLSSSSKTQHRTITYVRPTTCMSYRHCQFAFQLNITHGTV